MLNEIINQISQEAMSLKNKYIDEKDLYIDWVCVFSKSENEYKDLIKEADTIGEVLETTESGPIYKFKSSPKTVAGNPKVFKIRKFDPTKTERGDVDFTTEYSSFKSKYLDNDHFKLIKRDRFEMLELMDADSNARAYFSSIPPSKLRGIS